MQTTQYITESQICELVHAVYAAGSPVVQEAYSEFDSPAVTFPSASDLLADIKPVPKQKAFFYYAVYYPDAKGFVFEERIALDTRACKGHTYRFSQEGWGLIFLQITFRNHRHVECCVSVNSRARAGNWFASYPHLKSPDLWDWTVVKHHAGRLTRLLRKLGKQAG